MRSSTPAPADVLEVFDALGPPGTPFSTPEVAEHFDCTHRTVYNKLDALVEDGSIETKKVGARGRVWWRPVGSGAGRSGTADAPHEQIRFHPVFDSEMVGVIVWDDDVTVADANDAFLEMAGFAYEAVLGTSWQDLTPEEFYRDSERHIEQVDETGSGVPYEKQYYHADGSRWWGQFESRKLPDGTYVEFVVDVTERKEAKQELEREAERDAYRVELTDAIRPLTDPGEIQHEAAHVLGEWLDVDRADYGEVSDDGTTNLVHADYYRENDTSIIGEHHLEDYGEDVATAFQAGNTVVVDDARTRSELSEAERTMDEQADITGWIGVPLHKDGDLSAFFTVTDSEPREWTDAEVAMVEETADRTWDAVQRAAMEAELRENEARLSNILAQLPAGVGVLDADGTFELQNDRLEELVDEGRIPSSDPGQRENWTATDDDGDRLPPEQWPGARALRGEEVSPGIEFRFERDDETRWMSVTAVPCEGFEQRTKAIVVVQDVTERKRAEEQVRESEATLERLNDVSQDLIDSGPQEIEDRTVDIVQSVLDVEYTALWRYDETVGELEEHASRTNPATSPDAVGLPTDLSEQVWQTFIGEDMDIDNDVDVEERRSAGGRTASGEVPASESTTAPLRSRVLAPLGRHGVICAGSTRADVFDEQKTDLVETVAATVETAWDRAETERELAAQNEELTNLDRLNALIRNVDSGLVEADTRDAIDETVCERLAASALYEFAWVGEFDADADAVRPRSWAGADSSTVEELSAVSDDTAVTSDPFVTAIETHEMQVIEDIATDARAGPWREVALERGARSCLSIPLVYDESVYGVLVVYDETPTCNPRDTGVLAELGRTIAHAINAVETRETFQTDSVAELTLRSTAANSPLCRLARDTDSDVEFEGLVPGAADGATAFFTASGVTPDRLVTASEDVLGIEELVHLDERDDGALFKMRLAEPILASHVLDRDATVRSLQVDAGTATVVVDLPRTANVREFVEGLTREVPDLELLSRRTRTREPAVTLQTAVVEQLTPRQQEVLQLAYRSGYFETPRIQTGEELAEALDIVPSTFTKHIRRAERTLLDVVFANGHEPAAAGAK